MLASPDLKYRSEQRVAHLRLTRVFKITPHAISSSARLQSFLDSGYHHVVAPCGPSWGSPLSCPLHGRQLGPSVSPVCTLATNSMFPKYCLDHIRFFSQKPSYLASWSKCLFWMAPAYICVPLDSCSDQDPAEMSLLVFLYMHTHTHTHTNLFLPPWFCSCSSPNTFFFF